eukprot:gene12376-26032_t
MAKLYFLVIIFIAFSTRATSFSWSARGMVKNPRHKTHISASNSGNDITKKLSFLKKFAPIIGFYAVMLAPIYGIGLPGFFGSMTDFTTVRNRGSPGTIANEFIIAPEKFTPKARAYEAPIYLCDADTLQKKFDEVILKQPRISYINEDKSTRRKEYVQRSLIFRFPDVITYATIPLEKDKSSIAIHSYSIYGAGDLGVNRNRVELLLKDLAETVPVAQSEDE